MPTTSEIIVQHANEAKLKSFGEYTPVAHTKEDGESDFSTTLGGTLGIVSLDKLCHDTKPIRQVLDSSVQKLVHSMNVHQFMLDVQPFVVVAMESRPGYFMVIDGNHRLRALNVFQNSGVRTTEKAIEVSTRQFPADVDLNALRKKCAKVNEHHESATQFSYVDYVNTYMQLAKEKLGIEKAVIGRHLSQAVTQYDKEIPLPSVDKFEKSRRVQLAIYFIKHDKNFVVWEAVSELMRLEQPTKFFELGKWKENEDDKAMMNVAAVLFDKSLSPIQRKQIADSIRLSDPATFNEKVEKYFNSGTYDSTVFVAPEESSSSQDETSTIVPGKYLLVMHINPIHRYFESIEYTSKSGVG